MMEVWKFRLVPGKQKLQMSEGAIILHVHEQNGDAFLWAQVHYPTGMLVDRHIMVVATGEPFDENEVYEYVGSVHLDRGVLVFHVYELYPLS